MLSLLLISAAFAQEPCAQPVDLHALRLEMRQGLQKGAFAQVAAQGQDLPSDGTCLTAQATAEDLALAFQYAGLAELVQGDAGAARRAFRRAAVIGDEAVPFDRGLASMVSASAAALYAEELKAAKDAGYGRLSFCQEASLYGLQKASGAVEPALEGEHLVQWAPPSGGSWTGKWVSVKAGEETGVGCTSKRTPDLNGRSVALLSAGGVGVASGAAMIGTTYAWWQDNKSAFSIVDDGSGLFPDIDAPGEKRLQKFEKMRAVNVAGGVLALAGGGLLVAGGIPLFVAPSQDAAGLMIGSSWAW